MLVLLCKLKSRQSCEWGVDLTSLRGCKVGQSVRYQLPDLCVEGLRMSQAAASGHSLWAAQVRLGSTQ